MRELTGVGVDEGSECISRQRGPCVGQVWV